MWRFYQSFAPRSASVYKSFSVRSKARMAQASRSPKRFAPLDPQNSNDSEAPPLKGIIFDVDGTLWYVLYNSVIALELNVIVESTAVMPQKHFFLIFFFQIS